MSGEVVRLVTLGGDCFEAELRSVDEYQDRDGIVHKFYLTDMVSKRGKRLVSVFVSGTLAATSANYESRFETVRVNAIRRAFDEGRLSFDAPFDDRNYTELSLSPKTFETQPVRTDAEIRRYILQKAYWLAYRSPTHTQTGGILYPIQFDEPADLDYMGVAATDIWRNIRRMESQGLLEKVLEGHARPSELLLSKYESGEFAGGGSPEAPPISTKAPNDRQFAQLAIEEARKSAPEDSRIHPRVGVVVVKDGRILASAHRGEIPQCHAEFIALEKKLADVSLSGATVYTTLEPCTTRNHPKIPCATRLAERKVRRVVIGMLDPDDRISGRGQRTLRKAGIATELFEHDLMAEIEELNRDFIRERELRTTKHRAGEQSFEARQRPAEADPAKQVPSFVFVFGVPLGDNDSASWMMMLRHYGPQPAHNCDIAFYDDDRKNIEHQWLIAHPGSPFPPDGLAGESQKHIHVAEANPEGSAGSFPWNPLDPDRQHYRVSISCRDGVIVEKWEVTRVNGVLRSRITIEHGPEWVKKNLNADPVVFQCSDPEFISTPLASELPKSTKGKVVHPGWKPNHRFEIPAAIIDPNRNVQIVSAIKLPDGSTLTDFGCWNILTRHFGDLPS